MFLTKRQAHRLGQVLRDHGSLNTCRLRQDGSYRPVELTIWSPDGETVMTIDDHGEQHFVSLPTASERIRAAREEG